MHTQRTYATTRLTLRRAPSSSPGFRPKPLTPLSSSPAPPRLQAHDEHSSVPYGRGRGPGRRDAVGLRFVSIRSAGAAYSPGALALGRLLVGSLTLGIFCLVRREGFPPRSAWRGIAISGLLWFGLYMVVLNWGEWQVETGTAALVVNIRPILIALLSARLLGDAMPPRLLTGMAVSFTGAVTVGLSMSRGGGSSVLGVALCVLAALAYAWGVVAQKPALRTASASQVATFGCLVGAVACLPFAGRLVHDAAGAPLSATLNVVYLGVFPTALAFTTWAYALTRTTASRLGATTYAVPALVVMMSWLFLGETPGLLTPGGVVLRLAGVAVSRSRPRQAPVLEPAPQPHS